MIDQLVLNKLSKITGDKEKLLNFLDYIDAPDNLKALQNILEVFNELLNKKGFINFPKEAYQYQHIVNKLLHIKVNKKNNILGNIQFNNQTSIKSALHGVMSEHPLYTLLYIRSTINPGLYCRLQQAALTAIINPQPNSLTIEPHDISDYGLFIRSLTDNPVGIEWLEKNKEEENISLKDIYDQFLCFEKELNEKIKNWSTKENAPTTTKKIKLDYEGNLLRQLRSALRLLKVANGIKVIRRQTETRQVRKVNEVRSSLGIRGVSAIYGGRVSEQIVFDDEDDEAEYPAVNSIKTNNLSKEEENDLSDFGIELDELNPALEYIYVKERNVPAYAQAFSNAMRMRGSIKQIERQNQFLPLNTQMLNDNDIADLQSLIRDLTKSPDKENKIFALIIRVMFLTSSHINRALNLNVVQAIDQNIEINKDNIGYDINRNEWLLPIPPFEFKTEFNNNVLDYCRYTESDYFRLPDMFNFGMHLKALYNNKIPQYPFQNITNAEKTIKAQLKKYSERLTITRISRYFMLKVAGRYENTQASFLFGNFLSTSSARKYYLALNEEYLQSLYRTICSEYLTEKQYQSIKAKKPVSIEPKYIGGRYCPTLIHVRDTLKFLSLELKDAKLNLHKRTKNWIKFHNLFTAYSIYTQGLLTGVRSVVNPFVELDQMIPELNIAIFKDKCGKDQFHTRNIPLHPLANQIAYNYANHLKAILTRLVTLNFKSVTALISPKNKNKPCVFFLDEQGQWFDVRPKLLAEKLSKYTSLPMNSNRKLIRTKLIELNISAHSIDVLMGHGQLGEMFWQTYASHSFKQISKEVILGLDLIIKELDLKVLKGLNV